MKKFLFILLVGVTACGGGGSGDGIPDHCPYEGYTLWCSNSNLCCPTDFEYVCLDSYGETSCYKDQCPWDTTAVDFCGED